MDEYSGAGRWLTSVSGAPVFPQVGHRVRAGVGRDDALASSGGEGRVVRGASPTPVRVPVARVSMATSPRTLYKKTASRLPDEHYESTYLHDPFYCHSSRRPSIWATKS